MWEETEVIDPDYWNPDPQQSNVDQKAKWRFAAIATAVATIPAIIVALLIFRLLFEIMMLALSAVMPTINLTFMMVGGFIGLIIVAASILIAIVISDAIMYRFRTRYTQKYRCYQDLRKGGLVAIDIIKVLADSDLTLSEHALQQLKALLASNSSPVYLLCVYNLAANFDERRGHDKTTYLFCLDGMPIIAERSEITIRYDMRAPHYAYRGKRQITKSLIGKKQGIIDEFKGSNFYQLNIPRESIICITD